MYSTPPWHKPSSQLLWCLQVPVIDLGWAEEQAARAVHDACVRYGFLYGESFALGFEPVLGQDLQLNRRFASIVAVHSLEPQPLDLQ